jgi:FkbH-like protein
MNTDRAAAEPLRFVLISSFNLSNLASLLSRDAERPSITAECAPFGQVMQVLLGSEPELWKSAKGVVVWTSPESISEGFRKLVEGEPTEPSEPEADVDAFCRALKSIPAHVQHIVVATWALGAFEHGRGLRDLDARQGPSLTAMRMNVRLAQSLADDPRVILLDASRWISAIGQGAFSPRMWYMAKTPYGLELLKAAAREIKSAIRSVFGFARKLVILDLDDTLWGGIVGDVGRENLQLGGHDPTGEAFADFQRALKGLQRRGILLGIVSKNDEATALETIRSHPEMLLREDDFAGWRINWNDKAQNVSDLAAELNLGLQSIVFLDDNPSERARVREALPEVLVPDFPSSPLDYVSALQQLRCFDLPVLSYEDRHRSEMYLAERKRRASQTQVGSLAAWLESLDVTVSAQALAAENLERAFQLFNKTNQMNLSTRRLTKGELWSWSQLADHSVLVFSVSDRFGNYGLVGLGSLSVAAEGKAAAIVADFILSCRAMGRKVEETMLYSLARQAKTMGFATLSGNYLPTAKNHPCLVFLQAQGLIVGEENFRFELSLDPLVRKPMEVSLAFEPSVNPVPAPASAKSRPSEHPVKTSSG